MQAVKIFSQRRLSLQWIMGRYHKPYLLEVGSVCHELSNDQMPNVNRIERSKKQADVLSLGHSAILKGKAEAKAKAEEKLKAEAGRIRAKHTSPFEGGRGVETAE